MLQTRKFKIHSVAGKFSKSELTKRSPQWLGVHSLEAECLECRNL